MSPSCKREEEKKAHARVSYSRLLHHFRGHKNVKITSLSGSQPYHLDGKTDAKKKKIISILVYE
jgi:hypothetical protein